MAEAQFLFSEIEISRSSFERWLKSEYIPTVDLTMDYPSEKHTQLTVAQALLPFLNYSTDKLRILLLHNKQKSIFYCSLYLAFSEMAEVLLYLSDILKSIAPFIAKNKSGTIFYGENISGKVILSKNSIIVSNEQQELTSPDWANEWLSDLEDDSEENLNKWVDSKLWNKLKRTYNHYLRNATPENPIYIKNTDFFSDGKQVIDWEGKILPNANPLTFKRIFTDSLRDLYSDGNSVWIHGKLSLNIPTLIKTNLSSTTIRLLKGNYDTDFLLQIGNELWFPVIENRTFEIASLRVDIDSFHAINYCHYVDKDAFYICEQTGRGLFKVDNVDPNKIKVFNESLSIYEDKIFNSKGIFPEADGLTFYEISEGFYADKNCVWEHQNKLEGFNPKKFEIVDRRLSIVKDDNLVRVYGNIIPNADAKTVKVLDAYHNCYWRDKHHVWYWTEQIQPLRLPDDGELYFYPKSHFCRVGSKVWCQQYLLEDVDISTFTIIEPTIAKDKNFYFMEDRKYTHQEYKDKDIGKYYTFG
ncbi:hypothetical protein ABN085_19925 [Morganella morganii]|uniref:DKNYY domain-containing protein n=1 Tax=Morganella morganii TaxID=582 RepID=UPI0032DB1E3C